MLKGVILRKQKMYYTYMDMIFDAIQNGQTKYNWLISDYECNQYPDERIPFDKEYVWISGEELTEIVRNNQIQFIWAVFSAYPKNISKEEVFQYPLPTPTGFNGYSDTPTAMQNELAEIEIVAFDSTYVVLISKQEDVVDNFCLHFPLAENLK